MLNISKVAFPGLGIGEMTLNSVAFTIFGIEIAWYAVIITFGMIMAVLYCTLHVKKFGMSLDDVIDFALAAIPVGIVGARAYYVLTKLEDFPTFRSMLNIRGGGLAIYGGIIGGAIAVLIVCAVKKVNFLAFADATMPAVTLAQAIGRWGNFMNGEAYGYETDWFCRMQLTNSSTGNVATCVHPAFLYESLWNFVGVILASLLFKKKKYDGQVFLFMTGWYGLGRAVIEGCRTDSLYIPGTNLRISQVLAAALFLVCAVILLVLAIKKYERVPFHYVKRGK